MIASNLRDLTKNAATRRQLFSVGAIACGALAAWPTFGFSAEGDGISHSAESIHQEPKFTESPARVYEVLLDTKLFDKVIQASGVMQSAALSKMRKPTEISPEVGGAFSLFGGYIFGRHLELVPNELIVQAWRVGSWGRGLYSIVRFELSKFSGGTRILFDHTGFPKGDAEHLAEGWRAHYWDPMEKVLS